MSDLDEIEERIRRQMEYVESKQESYREWFIPDDVARDQGHFLAGVHSGLLFALIEIRHQELRHTPGEARGGAR